MSLVRPVLSRASSRSGGLVQVPADTEGDRGLLQSRLATFGRVAGAVSFAFYLLVNIIVQLGPRAGAHLWLGTAVNRWHLATTGVLALVWLLCRGARLSPRVLRAIDAVAILSIGTGFALMGASSYWHGDPTLPMVLAVTHAVGVRAVLIPSSATRSAVLHGLALLPCVASAYVIHRARLADEPAWNAVYDAVYTALWCGVAAVMSTLTSRVIYGLSQRVRESRELGQYTLEEKIGEGGMGAVYRARHAMLRRATAIKLLHPDRTGTQDLQRFEREVRLTSRLTHPNTIAIYDYGRTPEGLFYYAMEYLEGMDLQTLVERHGALPPARVIHVLRQVAGALGEAHGIGLIHRDVKPANVILCERGGVPDVAKVVDFGLVKAVDTGGDVGLTAADAITGTPLYMPPEAVRSPESVDARSDLYALGCVGYFLLAGSPVFEGDSVVSVLADHIHREPTPPSVRLGCPVPKDLEALLLRCLAKDPSERPSNAAELATALSSCEDANGWTAAEARAWWKSHAAERGAAPRDPRSPAAVTVDLSGRAAA